MLPRSSTLFHFTRSSEILKNILKEGFWPRYCLEDFTWHQSDFDAQMAFPMVCFCDIPISRIDEHIDFYGSFGIGMTKEWAIRNKLNPVIYLAPNSPLRRDMASATMHAAELPNNVQKEAAFRTFRSMHSFVKPLSGSMQIGGELREKDFYQESEWRYVPLHASIDQFLLKERFATNSILEEKNGLTRDLSKLTFDPKDIRYIFVPSDRDIPAIINFIQIELDHLVSAEIKILMSRVTSLENLQQDV